MINFKELEWNNGIHTLNGIPFTGCAVEYWPNGKVATESNFMNGFFEGKQRKWFSNGQLQIDSYKTKNLSHNKSLEWFENGVLRFEAEYEMGTRIWSKIYNEQGQIIKQHP